LEHPQFVPCADLFPHLVFLWTVNLSLYSSRTLNYFCGKIGLTFLVLVSHRNFDKVILPRDDHFEGLRTENTIIDVTLFNHPFISCKL
jgi:hypothetical protein